MGPQLQWRRHLVRTPDPLYRSENDGHRDVRDEAQKPALWPDNHVHWWGTGDGYGGGEKSIVIHVLLRLPGLPPGRRPRGSRFKVHRWYWFMFIVF